jgi:hypothetical protein
MQTEVLQGKHESRLADPLGVYGELPIEFDEVVKPPRQEYVVLGIFGDNGRLFPEVIVYIGGPARSKHLYRGLRRLFEVPILRDVTSFGLYKVYYPPLKCRWTSLLNVILAVRQKKTDPCPSRYHSRR